MSNGSVCWGIHVNQASLHRTSMKRQLFWQASAHASLENALKWKKAHVEKHGTAFFDVGFFSI
jgi:hypothetical protein